jgi:hypothetical protein
LENHAEADSIPGSAKGLYLCSSSLDVIKGGLELNDTIAESLGRLAGVDLSW